MEGRHETIEQLQSETSIHSNPHDIVQLLATDFTYLSILQLQCSILHS